MVDDVDAAVIPFRGAGDGVEVFVRATPRASAERVQGPVDDGTGRARLRVHVTAPPEDGKANAALIKLLAKAWRVPKSSMQVTAGETERNKTLFVAGDPGELEALIGAWLARGCR